MKLKKKLIIVITIILLIFFTLIKVVKVQDIILKILYPLNYQEQIEKYAFENGIDSKYVYAIIKAESNFNVEANSSSGAKGLMQIMDSTAQEIAKKLEVTEVKNYNLYDAETNIMFGTKYFADLLKEYDNNINLTLAAYNAGKGNVKKWIDNGTIQADGSDIENIPFKETNMYIRKILQNYRIYENLYKK